MRLYTVAALALGLWVGSLSAQPEIRREDHFWRKRIVQRLDLGEKINRPLITPESNYYRGGNGGYAETDGIVRALINGVKAGEFVAYHPEHWEQPLTYEDLLARMREFEKAGGGFGVEEEAPAEADPFADTEDPFADPFANPADDAEADTDDPFAPVKEDEWGSDSGYAEDAWDTGFAEADTVHDDLGGDSDVEIMADANREPDLLPYEESLHIVEDWIFDKTRSMMRQKVDYFEIIWTDPMGTLPEKVLARFLWQDVKERLDNTQWKGSFNDAENRSIAEAIELRMFHAYPISVGGQPISSLDEAERRRLELIEFEHHLWSY